MRTQQVKPSDGIVGEIQLRLSDAQLRMMRLENQKIVTVPIYEDIAGAPPPEAIEGQVALSKADLKVWWFSNQLWHTCGCLDFLDPYTRPYNLKLLETTDPGTASLNAAIQSVSDSDFSYYNYGDIIMYQGVPWVAWTPAYAKFGERFYLGPYVAKWNGTAFTRVGAELEPAYHVTGPVPEPAAIPTNVSANRFNVRLCFDDTGLYIVYHLLFRGGAHGMQQAIIRCKKWTGSTWALHGEYNPMNPGETMDFDMTNVTGSSFNGRVDGIHAAAVGGKVYALFSEYLTSFGVSTNKERFRLISFDGTLPPVAGMGDGYEFFLDLDSDVGAGISGNPGMSGYCYFTQRDMVTLPDQALIAYVPPNTSRHATTLNFHDAAAGAIGSINATEFDDATNFAQVKLSEKPITVHGIKMLYLAFKGTGSNLFMGLIERDSPLSTHHLSDDARFDRGPTSNTYPVSVLDDSPHNVWAMGRIVFGTVANQFVKNCVPPFWQNPPADNSNTYGTRLVLYNEKFWTIADTSDHMAVEIIPIVRCAAACMTPGISQFPFFSGGTFHRSTTQEWSADITWGFLPDNVKFYIDGTLVSTATVADGQTYYYGNTPPGTFNVSSLSVGTHEMKTVGTWTGAWGSTITQDIANINVAP
jgi:hypothetical protein